MHLTDLQPPRSGLTIPLQISLSDIKLSAFIILVFSRQKGVTLVFRNDPLESLKVSSTFDSIPFVRDYLQKEIEGQLRFLFMEELPAIIHRLSLRLWVPEYASRDEDGATLAKDEESSSEQKPINPLASPAQQEEHEAAEFSFDSSEPPSSPSHVNRPDMPSLFSQKNLLRLATLNNSHRTLALFTPAIRDAVFRAWAGASERGDAPGASTPATPAAPSLARSHSYSGSRSSTYVFSSSSSSSAGHMPRPSLTSSNSAMSGLGLASAGHGRTHAARKRRSRVVNLRRTVSSDVSLRTGDDEAECTSTDRAASSTGSDSATVVSEPIIEEDEELVTPPTSPKTLQSSKQRTVGLPAAASRPATPSRPVEPVTPVDQGTQTSPEQSRTSLSSSRPRPLHQAAAASKLQPVSSPEPQNPQSSRLATAPISSSVSASLNNTTATALSDSKSSAAGPPVGTSPDQQTWGPLERALLAKLVHEIGAGGVRRPDGTSRSNNYSSSRRLGRPDSAYDDEHGPPPAYQYEAQ